MSTSPAEATSDASIRRALLPWISECFDHKGLVVEEFDIASCRSDLCAVDGNGNLHGFEIKSARDSLSRLPRQVKGYDSVFALNWLVIDPKWIGKVEGILPLYWGIVVAYTVDGRVEMSMMRAALPNPKRKMNDIIWLLWKPEMIDLLRGEGHKRIASLPKYKLAALGKKLTIDRVSAYLAACLGSRSPYRQQRFPLTPQK